MTNAFFECFSEFGVQFEKYLPEKSEDAIYHYTSIESACKILFPTDKDDISIYATRIDSLNDYSENTIAGLVYDHVVEELLREGKITAQQGDCLKAVKKDGSTYPISHKRCEKYYKVDIYVFSCSKHEDLLNMWKYYTKTSNYEGVSIGLSMDKQVKVKDYEGAIDAHIYPVVYDQNAQKNYIKEFLLALFKSLKDAQLEDDKDVIDAYVGNALLLWNALFKFHSFSEEQEVRCIIYIDSEADDYKRAVKYRKNGSNIIPYITLIIDSNNLKSVCLGPIEKKSAERNKSIIENGIKVKYDKEVLVKTSQITLRF